MVWPCRPKDGSRSQAVDRTLAQVAKLRGGRVIDRWPVDARGHGDSDG